MAFDVRCQRQKIALIDGAGQQLVEPQAGDRGGAAAAQPGPRWYVAIDLDTNARRRSTKA